MFQIERSIIYQLTIDEGIIIVIIIHFILIILKNNVWLTRFKQIIVQTNSAFNLFAIAQDLLSQKWFLQAMEALHRVNYSVQSYVLFQNKNNKKMKKILKNKNDLN